MARNPIGSTQRFNIRTIVIQQWHMQFIFHPRLKYSHCERLLGIDIDCKLNFENHITQICSKAMEKIKALARIAPFLNKRKRKLLIKLLMAYLRSWLVTILNYITWRCIALDTGSLSILGQFAQSYMAQNHSPTWDRKFGNLCQVIWKTFHHSQPSKKPLNNGSHMLVHVGFVEPTSIRLVSFNLWIQNQLFLHGFLVLYMYIYVCVIFNFMLLEHYLLQLYLSYNTSVD